MLCKNSNVQRLFIFINSFCKHLICGSYYEKFRIFKGAILAHYMPNIILHKLYYKQLLNVHNTIRYHKSQFYTIRRQAIIMTFVILLFELRIHCFYSISTIIQVHSTDQYLNNNSAIVRFHLQFIRVGKSLFVFYCQT